MVCRWRDTIRRRFTRRADGVFAFDRNEMDAPLVVAGFGRQWEHALISLLALDGLRVPEATSADIERLGVERATGR